MQNRNTGDSFFIDFFLYDGREEGKQGSKFHVMTILVKLKHLVNPYLQAIGLTNTNRSKGISPTYFSEVWDLFIINHLMFEVNALNFIYPNLNTVKLFGVKYCKVITT